MIRNLFQLYLSMHWTGSIFTWITFRLLNPFLHALNASFTFYKYCEYSCEFLTKNKGKVLQTFKPLRRITYEIKDWCQGILRTGEHVLSSLLSNTQNNTWKSKSNLFIKNYSIWKIFENQKNLKLLLDLT